MYSFVRMLVEIFMRIRYHIVVHNPEKRKLLPKGGYIIACNHQFYSDPPLVAAMFRGKYSFIAKSELFKNPIFGWIIRKCGAFPVVRGAGDGKAIEKATEDIKNGRIFLIFPEGTRSKDGTIGRGKSGVALIAGKTQAPVLPVCIMYGLGGKKRRVDFAIGDLIPAEEIALKSDDRHEIRRISNKIMGDVKHLQDDIFENVKNSAK